MNLILIRSDEISQSGEVCLSDRRAEHMRKVLDVHVGQELKAGIVRGPRAVARVLEVGPSINLRLETCGEAVVPWIDLVLSVPRPKALSRVVQAAASFGVRRIDIVNAWRVDASYFSSPKLRPDALELDAWLGCEQGQQTYVPEVAVHRFFVPFVEQVLRPRLTAESDLRLLVAHPRAERGVEALRDPAGPRHRVVVAVGPDGGFLECEVGTLVDAGGSVVHFGQAVLRSETAVVAILSQLDLLRRLGYGRANDGQTSGTQLPDGAAEQLASST